MLGAGVYEMFFHKGPPHTEFHVPDPAYPLNKPRIRGFILLITGVMFIYSALIRT